METVIKRDGLSLEDVKHEPIGKECFSSTILNCLWLTFIPLGSIVMFINAYLHSRRTYVMCFYDNGMQDTECYYQLTKEDLKAERINSWIYGLTALMTRGLLVGYYLIHH